MKKIIVLLALGFAVWYFYLKPPSGPVITDIGADGSVLRNPVIEWAAPGFFFERFMPSFA